MKPAQPYDTKMVKMMRRTVAYFSMINKRSDLTKEDKRKLKDGFLTYTFLPRADTLHQTHTVGAGVRKYGKRRVPSSGRTFRQVPYERRERRVRHFPTRAVVL